MSIDIKDLLEAGVHFGHQTKRWNPRMKPYIFAARNGLHIIDLNQTVTQLDEACKFMAEKIKKGGEILFVATKKQAQNVVKETAEATKQLYITQRWQGGALTNFNTVKRSIKRLVDIEKMEEDGTINNYGKKEQASINREANRLRKNLDGMRSMVKTPAAMFIVDLKREHNALAEAHKLKIPVIALVDTNGDPTAVDYPIAGNDDAIRSVRVIFDYIKEQLAGIKVDIPEPVVEKKPEPAAEAAASPEAPTPVDVASLATTPAAPAAPAETAPVEAAPAVTTPPAPAAPAAPAEGAPTITTPVQSTPAS